LNIRFTRQADGDLAAIHAYIAEDSRAAADRILARMLQSIRYLKDFPQIGRVGVLPDTRELSILGLPYRAVYRIEGDTVLILTVLHTSRRFPP